MKSFNCSKCGTTTYGVERCDYIGCGPQSRPVFIDTAPGFKKLEMTPPTEGVKHDKGKPPMTLIPRTAAEQEALAFDFGAKKYGRFNFKKGMSWSRPLDAALRHITAFADGEDKDPESGLSHLAHARACLAMVMYYEKHGKGKDDRSDA
jgi:hypothetical protein